MRWSMTKHDIDDIIKTLCPNDEDYDKPIISPRYLRQELEHMAIEQDQSSYNLGYMRGFQAGKIQTIRSIRDWLDKELPMQVRYGYPPINTTNGGL